MLSQNQKLAEEAYYAKELASAAAVELKNLAEEVTKLSLENARQAKELYAAQEMACSRGGNGGSRKNEGGKFGRRGRPAGRYGEFASSAYDDVECWNTELDDMKMELQARKEREAVLEAALAEKERLEEEYKRRFDEAKKREASLENDLAGMWVLVAKLKKGGSDISELPVVEMYANEAHLASDQRQNKNDYNDALAKDRQVSNGLTKPDGDRLNHSPDLEPLLSRLKVNFIMAR